MTKKGWMIFAALVVAVAGIGFGVFMMISSNDTIAGYEKQIAQLKATNAELMNDVPEDGEGGDVDTSSYIYMGDWGVKIAVSDELKPVMSYVVDQGSLMVNQVDVGSVTISRLESAESECVDGVDTNTGETITCPEVIVTLGDYDYFVSSDIDISATALAEFLNPDNYSEF